MNSSIRVAIVGAGLIARNAHLPAWRAAEGADVVAVVDADAEVAKRTAAEWGIEHALTSMEEALELVDAVDICLPPSLHASFAIRAMEAGQHVLLEKPLAPTLAECREIAAVAAAQAVTLMVAENWPFSSAAHQVHDLLAAHDLGEPFLLQSWHESALYCRDLHPEQPQWLLEAKGAGGGYLLNAGIHSIALARHLLGEIVSVSAMATPLHAENVGFDQDLVAVANFESGALGNFSFTGRSRHLGERRLGMKVFGELGNVELDVLTGRVLRSDQSGESLFVPGAPSMGFDEEVQHFVDCVRSGAMPRTTAEDQIGTLSCVDAMYRSAAAGGGVVSVEGRP